MYSGDFDYNGSGLFDYIGNIFNPKKSRDTEKYLKKLNGFYLSEIVVYRTPIQSMISKLLNVISSGNFEKEKKKLNYDQIFHLFMIMKLEKDNETRYIRIEKQPNIVIEEKKGFIPQEKNGQMMHILFNKSMSFESVITLTQSVMGKEYSTYSNPYNNCQTFIMSLVNSMYRLIDQETPHEVVNFILQNVEDLVKGNTRNVSNFVTSLGHFFGRVMGHGLSGGLLGEHQSIVNFY